MSETLVVLLILPVGLVVPPSGDLTPPTAAPAGA